VPRPSPWLLPAAVALLAAGAVAGALWRDRRPAPWPAYDRVFAEVAPGVVSVTVAGTEPRFGSGFAVGPGEIVTARHLVVDGAILVRDADGRELPGALAGADARTDLALVWVPGLDAPALPLGRSDDLPVGRTVIAIGDPYGLARSLAVGVLAGRGRRIGDDSISSGLFDGTPRVDFLQLSVPLNPGNSGGPIVDGDGRVVGVLSGTHAQGQAIAFAVPVEVLSRSLPALRTGARVSRAFLGLRVVPATGGGVVVDSVIPSSPADRAGLRRGDRLTAFDDVPLTVPADLHRTLDHLAGGEQVAVRLLRDGGVQVVDVLLADWEQEPLVVGGMTLAPEPGSGGRVVAVREGSRAEAAGIRAGDLVRSVDGTPCRAPADVKEALADGSSAQVDLTRDGAPVSVRLPPTGG
jgi:S1-C subfamily serine protease